MDNIKEVVLTKLWRGTKDKQGNELKTKDGRNYEKVLIKTQEYLDAWLSGFGADWNRDWKVGDKVKILIEKVKVGDKEYLNFSKVNEEELLKERVSELERSVKAIQTYLLNLEDKKNPPAEKKDDYPEDIDPEAIPF
jgi:hypothetical protein